jgi:CubicO group peptidase (beta-lactamase class C family)
MKSRRLISILLLLSITIGLCVGFAPRTVQAASHDQPYSHTITTARTEIWKTIADSRAANASIAVMDGGQIVYSEGFGMSDRGQSQPVTKDSVFIIGSVSKVFVAVAVMQLVDEQKVHLDERVTTYIPEFSMADPRYKDITVRMLLNHSSGLPGTAYGNVYGHEFHPAYQQDLLDALKTAHLKHSPGELSPYCNDGFTLAEIVVERISEKQFIDFAKERIFQPLGLQHAGPSVGDPYNQTVAGYYNPANGKRPPVEVVSIIGASGLSMNPEDMCRFADSFSNQGTQILSEASHVEMLKAQPSLINQTLQSGGFVTYGLGWDMTDLPEFRAQGIQILGKGGATNHYSTFLATVPTARVSVAVNVSNHEANTEAVAVKVIKALLVEKGVMRENPRLTQKPPVAEALPQVLLDKQGLWLNSEGFVKITGNQETNLVTVSKIDSEDASETTLTTLVHNKGGFYNEKGGVLYLVEVAGNIYLVSPPFGDVRFQKVAVPENPARLRIDIDAKKWLRRNAKAYESESDSDSHIIKSVQIVAAPGYIDFGGIKKVEGPDFARIAATAFRDQSDLRLFDKDGVTWARLYDMLYSPASPTQALVLGANSVTIGAEGNNEWLVLDEGSILSFQAPAAGRILVFSPDNKLLYCSTIDSGEVYAPADSYVELAGYVGDTFIVTSK